MEWVKGALGVAALLGLVNLAGYAAMAHDKRCAERKLRRWPERRLLRIAFWGGSLGTLLAQRRLRHKTRKQPFARRLTAILCTQAILVLALVVTLATQAPLCLQAKQALGAAAMTVEGVAEAWHRARPTASEDTGGAVKISRGL